MVCKNEFGSRLLLYRLEKGWTQKQTARKFKVAECQISFWERSLWMPRDKNIAKRISRTIALHDASKRR